MMDNDERFALAERIDELERLVSDGRDIRRMLQRALFYWMPKVFNERSATDTYLLYGLDDQTPSDSFGEDMLSIMREIAALKRYDPNAAKGWKRSAITINVPSELLARLDALIKPDWRDDHARQDDRGAGH